ncbi:MAG: hypothetical protein IIC90_09730 [Chloroflexi bacterium]|nr:hypothetical protein [Chloroflexota bacterium]
MDYPAEATFYVRLSLMHPKPGQEERVSQILDDLLRFLPTQPGYVRGYKLSGEAHDPQGPVGRLVLWSSETDANNAATTQHDLSVRSELMQLIDEDSHVEHSYTAFDPQLA